jgi:DNA N-6-adenine-methyltransferase Dam
VSPSKAKQALPQAELTKRPTLPIADIRVGPRHRRELAERQASTAAANIHAFDKAGEIARRVKDASALEGALIGKLESQRDFAAEYRAMFPPKVRADDRVGASSSDSPVGSSSAEWCLSYGFHLRTVQRWLELLDAETYIDKKNAIFKRCWELAELWQAANYSSASVEWYTPARYLEGVRQVLDKIDLDPASSTEANAVVRASKIFTKDDDGLQQAWFGRVFMNPPYGRTDDGKGSLAGAFCRNAEYKCGNVEACIILVNSLHSQSWQAPLYDYAFCLVDHRIHFISADGQENASPTYQNVFVYVGHDVLKFAKVFARFGYVAKKIAAAPPPDSEWPDLPDFLRRGAP